VEVVRQLMQDQHKAMIVALREGLYDYVFDENAAKASMAAMAAK